MARKITACGNKVIVRPIPPADYSPGGICLVNSYQLPTGRGIVLSVGTGRYTKKGVLVKPPVNVGDKVQYKWIDGYDFEHEGEQLKVLGADELVAIEANEPEQQ